VFIYNASDHSLAFSFDSFRFYVFIFLGSLFFISFTAPLISNTGSFFTVLSFVASAAFILSSSFHDTMPSNFSCSSSS